MMDNEQLYSDANWIDYIENETAPLLKDDMALVLMNSTADREVHHKYEALRKQIKATNENSMPEDPAYYDKLKSRIMDALPSAPSEIEDARVTNVRVFFRVLRLATVLPFK
jgi:hypothetical protein